MKILRSKGQSFTQLSGQNHDNAAAKNARGLNLRREMNMTPKDFSYLTAIQPEILPDYISKDYLLILRQVVSAFDKVIRKSNKRASKLHAFGLKGFTLESYADRVFLAEALWKRLVAKYRDRIVSDLGPDAFRRFEETWRWKIHPYARYASNPRNPRADANARVILDYGHEQAQRSDFEGRWHDAFWKKDSDGQPDYEVIADRIFDHLFSRERKIDGELRPTPKRRAAGKPAGLSQSRGESIAASAPDPRPQVTDRHREDWSPREERLYFEHDVAATIHAALQSGEDQTARAAAAAFGSALYDHFGRVRPNVSDDDAAKQRFWNLHNAVRHFYQKLSRTERFRRALADPAERDRVVPADSAALLKAMRLKQRNADMGELIRLGKLIVHASDLATNATDVPGAFAARMEHFVTSDGQSEIKRNEAFTRVWRNAIGLSFRTLRAWADPNNEGIDRKGNDDLASPGVAASVMSKLDADHAARHAKLVFGDRGFKQTSRCALMTENTSREEVIWALLRLAGEIRDRGNHFCTKQRLVDLLRGGVLDPSPAANSKKFGARDRNEVDDGAVRTFRDLLTFDLRLQYVALTDDLERLDLRRYVPSDDWGTLLAQLAPRRRAPATPPPRFMAVMRHIKNLAANASTPFPEDLQPFVALQLDNDAVTRPGANMCQVGLLRLLYDAGFRDWLASKENDGAFIERFIRSVVGAKEERAEKYQEERGHFYRLRHSAVSDLADQGVDSLAELFRSLLSQATQEERLNQSYKADRTAQKKTSNLIERYRQELYAHLFAAYLSDHELGCIWRIGEPDEDDSPVNEVELEFSSTSIDQFTKADVDYIKDWHAQFYAWLYLVPPQDISLLRHQFQKTAVLEQKATKPEHERELQDLDWLMELYGKVQGAGFGGREHLEYHALDPAFLFHDPTQFERLFSEAHEDQAFSVPGTRRGLRQMLRFGHFDVFKEIFEKHLVTTKEVEELTDRAPTTKDLFEARRAARTHILDLVHARTTDEADLAKPAAAYQRWVVATMEHDFAANAARLTEHARLHRLLMRVVGRLGDFAMIWERDQSYAFLGGLYRALGPEAFRVELMPAFTLEGDGRSWPIPARIGIFLPDAQRQMLKQAIEDKHGPDTGPQQNLGAALARKDVREGFVSLWDERRGYALEGFDLLAALLPDDVRPLFEHAFIRAADEHPGDRAADARRKRDNQRLRESRWRVGRKAIRDDFAHYNVISTRIERRTNDEGEATARERINVTYLVNAIRSLLGYDRKLKNAVSKAIAKILLEEGLVVDWKLVDDRLKHPTILPACETHLGMLKRAETRHLQFQVPRASVRYTSMVKALFDFDDGGYRAVITEGGRQKRRGVMAYPPAFAHGVDNVPADLINRRHPAMR